MRLFFKAIFVIFLLAIRVGNLFSQENQPAIQADSTGSQSQNQGTTSTNNSAEPDSAFVWNDVVELFKKGQADTFKVSSLSVSFGYNFDFLDGIKTNDLYADFKAEFPKVFSKPKSVEKNFLSTIKYSFGLEAGAYQLRTVSLVDTISETFRLVNGNLDANDSLVISYLTVNSKSVKKTKRENFGVFIQPKFQLVHSYNKINKEESRLSLAFHAEWLRSIVNRTIERNTEDRTTSSSPPDDWPRPYNTVNTIPGSETNKTTLYNTYLGGGLDLKLRRKLGNFHLKTLIGYNNVKLLQEVESLDDPGEIVTRLSFDENWFYLIQMNVLETKLTGIKLGMEVRGVFTRSNPQLTLDRTVPLFSVYLAKQFGFGKIGDFLKGA